MRAVTDFDPPRTPLDGITDAMERAGDEWRVSLDIEAEAENEYRRLHSIEWVKSSIQNVAITARAKHCENQPGVVEARCAWNLAIAREKAAHSKVEEQRNRVMAAMSNQRFLREATGG